MSLFPPSSSSGRVLGGEFRGTGRAEEEITVPGTKPWDHLAGSVSYGRPPSPPQWAPLLPANCCTASFSHLSALFARCASPACPLLPVPGRKKHGDQSQKNVPNQRYRQMNKKITLPSSVSPSSSLRPLNHCRQSLFSSCSFCSSFSSSSLLSSYLCASGHSQY